MSRHKCTKELYKAFFQASSVRYSGLALSAVSPIDLSHDSINRLLRDKHFRPRGLWGTAKKYVDPNEPSLLIIDDTILSKVHSNKIELVNYQYSGNAHDVIAGIGWSIYCGMDWSKSNLYQSITEFMITPVRGLILYKSANCENFS